MNTALLGVMLGCTVKDIWSCTKMKTKCLYGCDEWCCVCPDREDCHLHPDSVLVSKYNKKFGGEKK